MTENVLVLVLAALSLLLSTTQKERGSKVAVLTILILGILVFFVLGILAEKIWE